MGRVIAGFYFVLLITTIVGFFLPSPYWMISVLSIVIMITIWFVSFAWRVGTAVDNFIEKYQDKNIEDRGPLGHLNDSDSNRIQRNYSIKEFSEETKEDMR